VFGFVILAYQLFFFHMLSYALKAETHSYINYIHIELLNVQLYLVHLLTVLAGSFNYTYMLK